MVKNKISNMVESILDSSKPSLDPDVWQIDSQNRRKPNLTKEAQDKIDNAISWVQENYNFQDLSVYIIGSICSNNYSAQSDIDIDFCAKHAVENDNNQKQVREFGWKFKEDFNTNYAEANPEAAKIGTHPFEVYFNPNPFQCFMSIGCYNVLEKKWEVGPGISKFGSDPIVEYYNSAMKQASTILEDIRTKLFHVYELAIVGKKSISEDFKSQQSKSIVSEISKLARIYKQLKKMRSNFQKPAKSKEEALARREDKKQHTVDAAFKFLDKFGYISMMKDLVAMYDDLEDGVKIKPAQMFEKILESISSNMQLQHIQDSDKQKFQCTLNEVEPLDERIGDLVKTSVLAAMMAIPSLLPAAQLAKQFSKVGIAKNHLTVNSKQVKKAVAKASTKDNTMLGEMSKVNVVNALAKVLWAEARGKSEGTAGRKAIASVIWNRAGGNPTNLIPVIKQNSAFSCLNDYKGGWTDATYNWFVPTSEITGNSGNKAIWDECVQIATQLANKNFKSTIGNRNAYLNKDTASKKAIDSWGKKCTYKVGSHYFGYLKEHDPKFVKPGTMTSWKKFKNNQDLAEVVVVVKYGDTLGKIAKTNNTTVQKILQLNPSIKNPNKISVGQKVKVA